MQAIDIKLLVEWLGVEGASVGLRKSDLSLSEIQLIVTTNQIPYSPKTKRNDLITLLVGTLGKRIDKTLDQLMEMDAGALRAYLEARKPSRVELSMILSELGLKPTKQGIRKLLDLAAREISDAGMYKRVAQGKTK